jgi:hypothetical protein
MSDIEQISPMEEKYMPYRVKAAIAEEKFNLENRDITSQILENLYRFLLGSAAGGSYFYY